MQTAILAPLFALVALTFAVNMWMAALRIRAVQRGEVQYRYFKLLQGDIPELPLQAANNFRNLLELPVLFYALIALLVATGLDDSVQVALAWAFVASRYAHSLIHLSYNSVPHRLTAFSLGVVILLVMWIRFAAALGSV